MSTNSRFADHWKFDARLNTVLSDGSAAGENADCSPPSSGLFEGIDIWFHPVDAKGCAPALVADDGISGFLVDDAIANVHYERYMMACGAATTRESLLKRAYYLAKPLLPRALQLNLQRINAFSRLRQECFPRWPFDDSVPDLLRACLAHLMRSTGVSRIPFIGFWPRGCSWAACFTHDIDTAVGLSALDRMLAVEEELKARSTWYFVPEKRYKVPESLLRQLVRLGHEVGVHGLDHGPNLFSSEKYFVNAAQRINSYIDEWQAVGFRSPALYRNPDWLKHLKVSYDSSFMDVATLEPQRGGVSAPFPYHIGDIIEVPITMPMDHHVINLLRGDVISSMRDKFDHVTGIHGLACFLFHPDYNREEERLAAYKAVFENVLATPGGWVTTAGEAADWWQRRHESSLVQDGDRAVVAGPAEPDAAIWHAELDGHSVIIVPDDCGSQ